MGKVEKKRDVSAVGVSLACVSATAGQRTDSSVASACIGAKRDHFIVLPRQAQDTNITETLNDCRAGAESLVVNVMTNGAKGRALAVRKRLLCAILFISTWIICPDRLGTAQREDSGTKRRFVHNYTQGEVEDWLVSRLIGEVPQPPPLELPLPFSLQDYVVRQAAPHVSQRCSSAPPAAHAPAATVWNLPSHTNFIGGGCRVSIATSVRLAR